MRGHRYQPWLGSERARERRLRRFLQRIIPGVGARREPDSHARLGTSMTLVVRQQEYGLYRKRYPAVYILADIQEEESVLLSKQRAQAQLDQGIVFVQEYGDERVPCAIAGDRSLGPNRRADRATTSACASCPAVFL